MTTKTDDQERAAFEAWYVTQTTQERDWWGWEPEHDQYGAKHSRLSWAAWQARAAVKAARQGRMPSDEEILDVWGQANEDEALPPRSCLSLIRFTRALLSRYGSSQPTTPPAAISRDLLGRIVDECFNGAIEDTSPIEDIYRVIVREYGQPAASAEPVIESAAENALRSLASWLGCGGYNAEHVDAAEFERKIRDGVDALLVRSLRCRPGHLDRVNAQRYRRARVLGMAPDGHACLARGTVLRFQALDDFLDADIKACASRGEAVAAPVAQEPDAKAVATAFRDRLINAMASLEDCYLSRESIETAAEDVLHSFTASAPVATQAQPDDFVRAVRHLCVVARTSGGTAGRDGALCDALDYVEAMLANSALAQVQPEDPATHLLAEAYRYWKYANAKHYGAVQWIEDAESGALLIYTRGEYRDTLMQNIHQVRPDPRSRAAKGADND